MSEHSEDDVRRDSVMLQYATPPDGKQARRRVWLTVVGLGICMGCAGGVVMASGYLIIDWTRIAHARMGCGNPRIAVQESTLLLAVPFSIAAVCWGKCHAVAFGLLKSCSLISLIVAAVAWVAAMWWTHWY